MIWGVLQRLTIGQQTRQRLVLRELPLLEWVIVGSLFTIGINLSIAGLTLSAVGAMVIGVILINLSRIREIVFDAEADAMVVVYQYLLRQNTVNHIELDEILRASLNQDDNGATQILLITTRGEMGLSVYSRDLTDWKETVVFAINEFLHNARRTKQQAENDDDNQADDIA